jgi:hypothetical protein
MKSNKEWVLKQNFFCSNFKTKFEFVKCKTAIDIQKYVHIKIFRCQHEGKRKVDEDLRWARKNKEIRQMLCVKLCDAVL